MNDMRDPQLCLEHQEELSQHEVDNIRNTVRTCLFKLSAIVGRPVNLLEVWHDQASLYPEQPEIGINIVSKQ